LEKLYKVVGKWGGKVVGMEFFQPILGWNFSIPTISLGQSVEIFIFVMKVTKNLKVI